MTTAKRSTIQISLASFPVATFSASKSEAPAKSGSHQDKDMTFHHLTSSAITLNFSSASQAIVLYMADPTLTFGNSQHNNGLILESGKDYLCQYLKVPKLTSDMWVNKTSTMSLCSTYWKKVTMVNSW